MHLVPNKHTHTALQGQYCKPKNLNLFLNGKILHENSHEDLRIENERRWKILVE